MSYTVSRALGSVIDFVRDWLFCPESIALFVSILLLFNFLRIVRGLIVCFCKWKYKDVSQTSPTATKHTSSKCNDVGNKSEWTENTIFRTHSHEAKTCDMAAFSIQGRRKTMEDRFNSLPHDYEHNHSFYAVFDGHGGEFAPEYIEDQIFRLVQKEHIQGTFPSDPEQIKQALTSIIKQVDAQLVCLSRDRMDLSGSTGILMYQKDNCLIVANIGDSRAVMCDIKGNVVPLSTDHKPCDPKEQKRIVDAGGFVTFNGVWRVAGVLACSRAFGDYPLKQRNFVTVEPEYTVSHYEETKPFFVILASDGLWDVFSNEEAVQFVSERLDEPHFGAKSLALQAYYKGSFDNITVMVINVKRKQILQRKFDIQKGGKHMDSDSGEKKGSEKDGGSSENGMLDLGADTDKSVTESANSLGYIQMDIDRGVNDSLIDGEVNDSELNESENISTICEEIENVEMVGEEDRAGLCIDSEEKIKNEDNGEKDIECTEKHIDADEQVEGGTIGSGDYKSLDEISSVKKICVEAISTEDKDSAERGSESDEKEKELETLEKTIIDEIIPNENT